MRYDMKYKKLNVEDMRAVICNVKRNVKNWQVFLFAVFWLFFCCFYRREM